MKSIDVEYRHFMLIQCEIQEIGINIAGKNVNRENIIETIKISH